MMTFDELKSIAEAFYDPSTHKLTVDTSKVSSQAEKLVAGWAKGLSFLQDGRFSLGDVASLKIDEKAETVTASGSLDWSVLDLKPSLTLSLSDGSPQLTLVLIIQNLTGTPAITGSTYPIDASIGSLGSKSLPEGLGFFWDAFPSSIAGVTLSSIEITAESDYKSIALSADDFDFDLSVGPFGKLSLQDVGLQLYSGSKPPDSNKLNADFALGGSQFSFEFDFDSSEKLLIATWKGHASLIGLLKALGVASDLPSNFPGIDISNISLQVSLDNSGGGLNENGYPKSSTNNQNEGDKAGMLTVKAPNDSEIFLLLQKEGGSWGYVVGALFTDLSQVSGDLGKYLGGLDILTIDAGFFAFTTTEQPQFDLPTVKFLADSPIEIKEGLNVGLQASWGASPLATIGKGIDSGTLLVQADIADPIANSEIWIELDANAPIPFVGKGTIKLSDAKLLLFPEQLTFGVSGTLALDLTQKQASADEDTLDLTATLSISDTSVSGSLEMTDRDGLVHAPLGFQGVTIYEIGGSIDASADGVGFVVQGKFYIGGSKEKDDQNYEVTLGIDLDGEIPNPVLIQCSASLISLGAMAEGLLGENPSPVLNSVAVSDFYLYWVEEGTQIILPDQTVATPGFAFHGDLNIVGFHAYAAVKVIYSSPSSFTGQAETNPIHFGDVLSITGNGKGTPSGFKGDFPIQAGGPTIAVSTESSPYLDIDWDFDLLGGVRSTSDVEVTDSGITVNVKDSLKTKYAKSHFGVKGSVDSGGFNLAGTLGFSMDLKIPSVSIGGFHMGSVDISNAAIAADLSIGWKKDVITLSADLNATVDGIKLADTHFDFHENVKTLEQMIEHIAQYILDHFESVFSDLYSEAKHWVQGIEKGIVKDVDKIGKVLGHYYHKDAHFIGNAVGKTLKWGRQATATALHDAGIATKDAAKELKSLFDPSKSELKTLLSVAGFPGNEIASVLKDIFGGTHVKHVKAPLHIKKGIHVKHIKSPIHFKHFKL